MKVIFLTVRETLSPVVEAQILQPASKLAEKFVPEVVAVTPVGQLLRREPRRRIKALRARAKQKYELLLHLVLVHPKEDKAVGFERFLALQKVKKVSRGQKVVIHARGSRACSMALSFREKLPKGSKVIYDCRGDELAEAFPEFKGDYINQEGWPQGKREVYKRLLERERRVCSADKIICVSEKLREVLVERQQGMGINEKTTVIPCCTDFSRFGKEGREVVREELGISNRLVVCYLGSLEWYQMPEESIRLFKLVKERLPEAFFLAITSHPARMERVIEEKGLAKEDYKIVTTSLKEVPKYLVAADVGLLLRELNAVNEVASPVKFAEYVAAGLKVILTEGVGDYSQISVESKTGYIVDIDSLERSLSGLKEFIFAKSDEEGLSNLLDVNKRIEDYEAVYQFA